MDDSDIGDRLEWLATVLEAPKAFAVTIGNRYQWKPVPGSVAEHDLNLALFAAKDNESLLHSPRSPASLHLFTAAHQLAAISALIRGGEAIGPPMVLARAAYENAVIGFFVIDPTAGAARRSARAVLQDILGAYWRARSDKLVGGEAHPGYERSAEVLERVTAFAEEHFTVVIGRRIEHSTVEGERQPTFNESHP